MQENYILYPILAEPVITNFAEAVLESKFHFPWSEPVRFRRIHVSLIASGMVKNFDQPLPPTSLWYVNFSEPVRFLQGTRVPYHKFNFEDTEAIPRPDTIFGGWFPQLSDPVRLPIGTKAPHHYPYFGPERLLPTPNVFLNLSATENNQDAFLAGLNVFDPEPTPSSREGASVVIIEVQAGEDAAISIRE